MSYNNIPIGTANPGLILILVDQSYSMTDPYGAGQKKDVAALAVNRAVYEIILACQSGESIKDRCFVGILGYGASVEVHVHGMISHVADNHVTKQKVIKKEPDGAGGIIEMETEMPVWITPKASNGTPMHEAFDAAYSVAEEWVQKNPDSFPPIVINVTDGDPNKPDETKEAAKKLMQLSTTDGNLLLMNAHISNSEAGELSFPNSDSGLYDQYAKYLFDISSELPETLSQAAMKVGFSPLDGSRCFVFNAKAETLIMLLNFGSMGAMR